MVDLSKTFTHCLHCGNHTSEPRNVCPVCDWPRAHSAETAPPVLSCADPNAKPVQAAQQVVTQPHLADIPITGPVTIPGQAPASVAAIVDLGVLGAIPDRRPIIGAIHLAPEDPEPAEVE